MFLGYDLQILHYQLVDSSCHELTSTENSIKKDDLVECVRQSGHFVKLM
jgi:hypothetical protein